MFRPKNYNITFAPDLDKFTYTGREIITFDIAEELDAVTLDSVDLEIVSCQLSQRSERDCFAPIKSGSRNDKKGLKIYFPRRLQRGEYQLVIEFRGTINNFLAGWSRSHYLVNGEKRYIATTHFEPADARRVFPCVDNPYYKATFDISLKIDDKLRAVSNMPVSSEKTIGDNKKLVTFAQTPLMSTYLLYLGVGEFEFLETEYRDVVIRGVTTPGKIQYTHFALDCAKKFLAYFEEYFDFKYPLPKIDFIGVADFGAAGMEQWGAITCRENVLFYIPGKTSVVMQKRIAEVIAHELCHQWFGDLVTMKWWDDLWLNESFANFLAYKAVDHFWPEWHVWTDYLTDTVFEGMALDSLRSSHPIQAHIENVDEIHELFDEIAYDKGGSTLRMLEEYLCPDVFRDGLRAYIKNFQYSNAEGKDLWNTLERTSNKPVTKLMESFIKQTGFPAVFVNQQGATLSVRQKRFSFSTELLSQRKRESRGQSGFSFKAGENSYQTSSESWFVPMVIQDNHGVSRHLLERKEHEFILPHTPEFVNVNYLYSGFYISTYSNESLTTLGKNLSKLHTVDRTGILHDLYYSVLATKRTIVDFADFVERFFGQEKDPTVLVYILNTLLNSYLFLKKERLQELAKDFAIRSLEMVRRNPAEGEDPDDVVLRNLGLYALSLFNDKDTKKFVKQQFSAFLADEESLHQDLRGVVYSMAVWDNDENYVKVLDLYRNAHIQEERVKLLSALARTRNEELLKKTFDFSLSDEVSYSNIIYVFASLSRNPYARRLTIDWLRTNWDTLVANGGGIADMLLRRVLKLVVPSFGIGREEEMRKFLNRIRGVNLKKTTEQVMEELEVNSRFVERNRKLI